MSKPPFVEIDHSGDVGIEAWGETPARLFENAALGLFSLMASGPIDADVEREITATATAPSDLLVDWLSEIILASGTHGEVYTSVRVDEIDSRNVRGVVAGAPLDAAAHALRFEVKAATYHGLLYEASGGEYRARVIFDL